MTMKMTPKDALYATYDNSRLSAAFERLRRDIASMRRHRRGGRVKPHKLILLLAVTDLFEDGLLYDNRVYFNDDLRQRFKFYFSLAACPDDSCRAHIPFVHLRSVDWWQLQPKHGRLISFSEMRTCHSAGEVVKNIECATIDEDVCEVFMHPGLRGEIRRVIASELGDPRIADVFYSDTHSKGGPKWLPRRNGLD